MRANTRMRALLDGTIGPAEPAALPEETVPADALPEDARAVVADGWVIGPNDTLLLRNRWPGRSAELPPAEIGSYEYEINDVFLSLDDLRGDHDFLRRAAARTVAVARRLLRSARGLPGSETLTAVATVAADEADELFALQGGRIRLFTRRGDYPSWFDDLETFELHAVALLDATDLVAG
jgi:hypothetical protein